MDIMTFLAKIIPAIIWPAFFAGLLFFYRENIANLLSSIQKVKLGNFEFEIFGFTENKNVDILMSALQNGPHSFEWLRKNTPLNLPNDEFNKIIENNQELFRETKMIKAGENFDEGIKFDGVKLTQYAICQLSEIEYSGSGSGSEYGSGSGTGSGSSYGSGSYHQDS